MVTFGFLPHNLGCGRDLQMILCHSMNAGLNGGDIQTLPAVIEFI